MGQDLSVTQVVLKLVAIPLPQPPNYLDCRQSSQYLPSIPFQWRKLFEKKKRFTIKSRTQASKNFYAELRGQELCPGCQSLGEAASLWNADGMVYEVEVSSGEHFKETKAGWVANSPQDILALKCNS